MNRLQANYIYAFFGIYMLIIGILAFVIIGTTAKTALFSGGSMGILALVIAHFANKGKNWAYWVSFVHTLLLLLTFGWRASMAFCGVMEYVASGEEFIGKSAAFLSIASMFVMSLITFSFLLSVNKKS